MQKDKIDQVLKTLVIDFKDTIGAERFAREAEGRGTPKSPLHFLAQLYMNQENQEDLVSLIDKHTEAMDAIYLLTNLPSHWKVSAIQVILQNYEKASIKLSTGSRFALLLSKSKHLKLRKQALDLTASKIFLHPSKNCALCGKKLAVGEEISLKRNEIVAHAACS